ncbi:MAG: hypothetical protein QM756_26530 [Polyangiaceae bacterium]
MASKKTVQNQVHAGNTPVSESINRAAERIGLQPERVIELRDVELDMLRNIAQYALATFEVCGHPAPDPQRLLSEALRAARSDFGQLQDYEDDDDQMAYCRAQYRCDLALKLADYIETFGQPLTTAERARQAAREAEHVGGAT